MSSPEEDPDESRNLAGDGTEKPLKDLSDLSVTRASRSSLSDSFKLIPLELQYKQLGRYRIDGYLGSGGFGHVFLAFDPKLNRAVAIKVPKEDQLIDPDALAAFLREAQLVAKFQHPGLVSVYDIHTETDTEPLFIVLEYLPGPSLDEVLTKQKVSRERAVDLIIHIAEAIHYAHQAGLVHRDLKPANVILNSDGKPVVTDFGLAIEARDFASLKEGVVGTPKYMSPEQMRGETHRLDARTDVWAIGVILYKALTRGMPFSDLNALALYEAIQKSNPTPPRQIDTTIPRELERICLCCLSSLMADRFDTALELADELKAWRATVGPATAGSGLASSMHSGVANAGGTHSGTSGGIHAANSQSVMPAIRVVPHGLRSFDEDDADFFLSLLPGPFDRDGVPRSLRKWKQNIETREPDRGFSVGLLYGPSGCGKSSFLRAGLLPRLDPRVLTVFAEATANDTEQRLRRGVQHRCPHARGTSLAKMFFEIRQGRVLPTGSKLLIVIDQFEQWLHAQTPEPTHELVQALRQCDGDHVQVLLLVRDDFAMSAARFLKALEIPLVEGRNYATIDLFDTAHARRVLALFGQAHGQLPFGNMSHEQSQFLDQSIKDLAEHGRVVPVRLALFAEMMRSKPWTATSLKLIGGAEGVGVKFLEESFDHESTNPHFRMVAHAARKVLRGLLPEPGSVLKGHSRNESELSSLAGLADQPELFADVLSVLDSELRLITPTNSDDENSMGHPGEREASVRSYQLTHDYLVPALRVWFERREQSTFRGRTRLLLERRTGIWNETQEKRHLPSLLEWLRIRLMLRKQELTETQRTMVDSARRIHLARTGIVLAVVLMVGMLSLHLWNEMQAGVAERNLAATIEQVLTGDVSSIGELTDALPSDSTLWEARLRTVATNPNVISPRRLNARIALTRIDASVATELATESTNDEPKQVVAIAESAKRWPDQVAPALWSVIADLAPSTQQLRAACLLAQVDPTNARWVEIAEVTSRSLVAENSLLASQWLTLLQPIQGQLLDPLTRLFHDDTLGDSERNQAASILALWCEADLDRLVPLAMSASPQQYAALLSSLETSRDEALLRFREIANQTQIQGVDADTENSVRRKGMAILSEIRLAEANDTWSALAASPDPRLRTWLIDRLPKYGVKSDELRYELSRQTDGLVRQAMVLMLDAAWPFDRRASQELLTELTVMATSATDARERSAAEWVLRRRNAWAQLDALPVKSPDSTRPTTAASLAWSRNSLGNVMVQIQPAEFLMGSSPSEVGREKEESQHRCAAPRPFWIAVHEVTINEFKRFRPSVEFAGPVSPSRLCPMNNVDWFEAVAYCRWLSEQEGIPEDQMVYPPLDAISRDKKLTLSADALKRTGYRLPTEVEWEFAARAGTTTARFFGETAEFGHSYATYANDTLTEVGIARPNQFGLCDLLGNVAEWCHSDWIDYPSHNEPHLIKSDERPVLSDAKRVLRGMAYRYQSRDIRSAKRLMDSTVGRSSISGFRVVRTDPLSR